MEKSFVLSPKKEKRYIVQLSNSNVDKGREQNVILTNSEDEAEMILQLLGNNVQILDDEELKLHHSALRKKYENKVCDVLCERFYKWNYTDVSTVRNLFKKIPFNYDCIEELDKKEKISNKMVHKKNKNNILISDYYQDGMVNYFRGFTSTEEIIFDHTRDHIAGILLFEVIRQAGIASTHLGGLNEDGIIVISDTYIQYSRFIVSSKPFYIRTISINRSQGGNGFFVYEVFQDNQICVSGWFTGISFINNDVYEELKNMVSSI